MRKLFVFIEIEGKEHYVGEIFGSSADDACFSYDDEYIAAGYPSISISLPTSMKRFTAEKTKIFFEGLLPEGFARKSVAAWIHAKEEDYLTILSVLGSECLGALRVSAEREFSKSASYRRLSIDEVKSLAREGVSKSTELVIATHLSLTGASGKVGLYYDQNNDAWYQPLGLAPSTHIVKQSHVRLAGIVTNEQLSLLTAKKLGIETSESIVVNTGAGNDDEVLFATRRYDRVVASKNIIHIDNLVRPNRLHQEDFAQAMSIAGKDKYENKGRTYFSGIFNVLRSNVANPIRDQVRLLDILIYDFLLGNADNHIKNLSFLYSENMKNIRLAPAYDIISTVIYSGSSREMALGINGKRNIRDISRDDFLAVAPLAGLSRKMVSNRFDTLADKFQAALTDTAAFLQSQGYKDAVPIKEKILKYGGYSQI